MKRGKFIVIEGGSGCGKTTQIELLKKYLKSNWKFFREPGGTEYGEKVRDAVQGIYGYKVDEYASMLGYSSSRANLIRGVILPLLKKGKNVILDRYWYSTFAYQSVNRVSKKDIIEISKVATANLIPDLIIFYDLDPKLAMERKKGKEDIDRYDIKKITFHKKVRNNYRELSKLIGPNWNVIDASKSIDDIQTETQKLLKRYKIVK